VVWTSGPATINRHRLAVTPAPPPAFPGLAVHSSTAFVDTSSTGRSER